MGRNARRKMEMAAEVICRQVNSGDYYYYGASTAR